MTPQLKSIIEEFRAQADPTRRMLERVPGDKLSWKPHTKSRTLGELAAHIAGIAGMAERIATTDEFSPGGPSPLKLNTVEEIRERFDQNMRSADDAMGKMSDQAANAHWRLVFQGKEIFSKPRVEALRTNVLNHLYHHRGQLSVYLRLLDVPLPAVFGPTADENPFM
ncbi:MAG: DinB family protein [Acidobacteria bacterium]|nr:DinB family protein [Acidobacteriota bacterium]MBV9144776.1 DinB family protein [Acidobacteriota bacterium]MBV9436109.1 DinB family protein [Acidobacteriota bacterium]